MKNKGAVLVVAAHPDDEVLGCGATIARLSQRHEIHILILGEGATSRYPSRGDADPREVEKLQKSAHAAGSVLGARSVKLDEFPDNQFDSVPLLNIVKKVEQVVEELRPERIYTHHPGDLN